MFTIVITEKGGKKERIDFDEEAISIGRVQGNQVVLPRGNVSKQHCKIEYSGGEFKLTDLNSTNGTYVNGRKISETAIVVEGDKIYVGEFILSLETGTGDGIRSQPITPAARKPVPLPKPKVSIPQPKVSPPKKSKDKDPEFPSMSSINEKELPSVISDDLRSKDSTPLGTKGIAPVPKSTVQGPVPKKTPLSTTAHLEHLMDFVALEIKRIDRPHMPCRIDEGTAGKVRIVLKELVNDLIERNKLDEGENPHHLLGRAFLSIVDLGPLTQWLSDDAVSEIRITDWDQIQLRQNDSWIQTTETFQNRESLTNTLQCLGAGLPGGNEDGIPGVTRFRLETGEVVVVQYPPVSTVTTCVIYKKLSERLHMSDKLSLSLPPDAQKALENAVTHNKRIAVVGGNSPIRLSIITDMVRLLPHSQFCVGIEELPLMGLEGQNRITLAANGLEKTVSRKTGVHSLLSRATDLNPDWIVTRSVKWTDVPGLLACSAPRRGVIAELPLGGIGTLDRELMVGLLAAGISASVQTAGALLAAAFDIIIITGLSKHGEPIIEQILQTGKTGGDWAPKVVYKQR